MSICNHRTSSLWRCCNGVVSAIVDILVKCKEYEKNLFSINN
jgi:hypothetical protein